MVFDLSFQTGQQSSTTSRFSLYSTDILHSLLLHRLHLLDILVPDHVSVQIHRAPLPWVVLLR